MKKTFLTLALVALTTVATYAQGTIAFNNSALTQVRVVLPGQVSRLATSADNLMFGAFYAGSSNAAPDALNLAPGTASIGQNAGVINAPSVFPLPGTDGGQVVSLQIRAWDSSLGPDGWRQGAASGRMYGETRVVNVTLAPTAGPGQVIWQTASGTNPNRFNPLQVVPEPSTIALAVLGLGSLLLFRRRK